MGKMLSVNGLPQNGYWVASIALWVLALMFLVFLYVGLYAGYNSTIPIIGKPTPTLMFLIRMALGTSLVVGIVTATVILVWGTFRQRVVAVLPTLLFLFVLYFLAHQFIAVLWRKFW
jgi:hypothetical protein